MKGDYKATEKLEEEYEGFLLCEEIAKEEYNQRQHALLVEAFGEEGAQQLIDGTYEEDIDDDGRDWS
ncbi:MAG: hypothetical protein HQL69_19205 [Magnetococcales bacterium]|nr:hypothetical protein [Magnetococcales bacterium]